MTSLSKPRQIFLYVATFPALAAYKVWTSLMTGVGAPLTASLAMLVYCLLVLSLAALRPDLTIRSPSDTWLGIVRGELDGQEACMRQAHAAKGDLGS